MSRIVVVIIALFAVANLSACGWDIGKGKGKAPPPAAAAVYK
ncbi:ABC transporter [Rhizobium sp. RAF56]|jgi:outer membrane lipopolysaccharide assembly protein LptE/RlpB